MDLSICIVPVIMHLKEQRARRIWTTSKTGNDYETGNTTISQPSHLHRDKCEIYIVHSVRREFA